MSETSEPYYAIPFDADDDRIMECSVCGETAWGHRMWGWECLTCHSEFDPNGTLMFRGDNQAKEEK